MSRTVDAGRAAMRAVRTDLRDQLAEWQLEERLANAVLDVAHELIVNAHQHGAAPVHLAVVASTEEIWVEVRDASPTPAKQLPYRPGVSEHGLGLQLVRQLSTQWGQTPHDRGSKSVWARFVRPAPRTG